MSKLIYHLSIIYLLSIYHPVYAFHFHSDENTPKKVLRENFKVAFTLIITIKIIILLNIIPDLIISENNYILH
jgi:hypothetical protein